MAENKRGAFEARLRLGPLDDKLMAQLVRALGLEGKPARELEVCLRHAEADLEQYVRTAFTPDRGAMLLDRREDLAKTLRKLADQLGRVHGDLQEILPNASLEALGVLLERDEIKCALRKASQRYLLEYGSPDARRAVGLQHGGTLLIYVVDRVLGPLEAWLEENRLNKGGRPPDRCRRFLIFILASAAPDVLGGAATSTARGRFTQLCVEVFHAYGLATDGVEDIIEDEVRKVNGARSAP